MSTNNLMIESIELKKSYGKIEALRGINLKVKKGEFLTIFGPNGAGKTTLLKILSNIIKLTGGKISIKGKDICKDGEEIRKNIGVISHNTYLYNNLTPYENLKFYGTLYGVDNLDERIVKVIEKIELKDRMHDPVRTFSRGMQQRISIARAIIHDPSILFLDEPYTGLDQHAAYILKEILNNLKNGSRTIIMTTHNIARGLEVCDRVVIQVKGRLVFEDVITNIDKAHFEKLYFKYVEG